MSRTHRFTLSALAAGLLTLAGVAQAQTPPAQEKGPFSFFVTSVGSGKGADFGGLAGADAHCQKLAAAVGAGDKTWRAYLSTQAANGQPAINARDRIGTGPWYNVQGGLVARSVSHLHGDVHEEARIGNALNWRSALTETGAFVKRSGDTPNEHDILTGSRPDGTAADSAAPGWPNALNLLRHLALRTPRWLHANRGRHWLWTRSA